MKDLGLAGHRRTPQIPEYVVVERRHALEWIIGDSAWDDVELDT